MADITRAVFSTINEGTLVQLPYKGKRKFLHIEPIDENYLVAYAINNYRSSPNPIGRLVLWTKTCPSRK